MLHFNRTKASNVLTEQSHQITMFMKIGLLPPNLTNPVEDQSRV